MAGDDEPESKGGTHGGWDQIAETAQIFEAELIALRLREAGIEAEVVDQTFHQEPLPNVRSFSVVRVLVPKARADEARRILDQGLPLPEDGESE
jgi:putative signal transducing protein